MAIGSDIEQWKDHRSNDRPVIRRARSNRYIDVRISTNDCVLTSRREDNVPDSVISDWYECLQCGRIHEMAASKSKVTECSHCRGAVIPIGEPNVRPRIRLVEREQAFTIQAVLSRNDGQPYRQISATPIWQTFD
jgi:DNA-directed RNA polymerase subunit RPC12/RpoP